MFSNCLLAFISLFHFINVPVVNMRESPTDASQVVSQAYFSEEVHVIEDNSDWIKVETVVDHYQGWIPAKTICHREAKYPLSTRKVVKVRANMVHLYHVPDTMYGPLMTLPFESLLQVQDDTSDNRWIKVQLPDERDAFIQRGDVTFDRDNLTWEEIPFFSSRFMGLPYTWGGRSSFGYDCSGFAQMLYRQVGIHLPRDSKDQMKWEGFKTISIDKLSPGDLIFFGLDEDRIRHVGIYLRTNEFIHATVAENLPYIRISHLSDPEWNGFGKYPYRVAKTLK